MQLTRRKQVLYSFIAVVVIPLLILTLLELGLRLAGIGTSYDYFHEIEINGEQHFQDNKQFANQFYPPSLGVGPLNNTFSAQRTEDQIRVFILGGSAAQGFPHVNHGLDRHLSAHLRAALPDKTIEVINTAMTSVNSHVVYEVAKGIPEDSADFAVILMGNNEVVGPYGPSTFSQNFSASMTLIRTIQALKRSRIYQLLASLIQMSQNTEVEATDMEWQGMQMFTQYKVTEDDPRLDHVYRHYKTNLKDIIETLQEKNIQVILSTVPVNLRHSAPFGSAHSADLTDDMLARWNEVTDKAKVAYNTNNWLDAIQLFESAIAIDPMFADSHFMLATAYDNVRQFDKARKHYQRALDLDTLRFRSSTRINQIISEVAENQQEAIKFVDNATAFVKASSPASPGWNLLHEHVHFDFSGNHVLATEISRAIIRQVASTTQFSPLTMTQAAEWVGFPNHETIEVMQRLERMVSKPPFATQSNAAELLEFTRQRKASIIDQVRTPSDVIRRRQPLVASGNADWKIHFELAALNRHLGNYEAVKFHYKELMKLYPYNHESYMNLAETYSREGSYREAIYHLQQSLYFSRGDETKESLARVLLGLTHFKASDYDQGTEYLIGVINDYPDQVGACLRAYGTLVKYARDNNRSRDLNRYIGDAQRYANRVIQRGLDKDFPLIYRRMAQIMTMAGNTNEARNWQRRQPK